MAGRLVNAAAARDLLLRHGALLEGHFRLSSGRHSDRYLQCAAALQHPEAAELLGRALAEAVTTRIGFTPDVVVSPALGGLIIGHETGRGLQRRACFTERIDGRMVLRRGFALQPGERVLVIEDVVTTGLSSQETMHEVSAQGGVPVAVGCIANRSEANEIDGRPVVALLSLHAPTWPAEECPLCAAGGNAVKPGSRGTQ